MNEQLQQQLAQYLERFASAVETGADFAGQQIPLVIQEKLTFDFWMAWFYIGMGLLILFAVAGIGAFASSIDEDKPGPGAVVGAVIGLIPCTVITLVQLHTILQISLAPRLYIIEWAGRLLQ